MRKRILTIGRTDVYVHAATLLFMLYALVTGYISLLLCSMASVLLHESAHAGAAALAGRPPREIELSPLGAVMRLDDEYALRPVARLLMLCAGPAATMLICLLSIRLAAAGMISMQTGQQLFMSNLAILLINVLPALPLDGGRLLMLLLSMIVKPHVVRVIMRISGTLLGLAAIGLNIWVSWQYGGWNLSLAAAGCYLLYSASAATTTLAMAELRTFMDRKIRLEKCGGCRCVHIAVFRNAPLRQAIRRLLPGRMCMFTLLEPGTMRCTGQMTEFELIAAYLAHPEYSCAQAAGKADKADETVTAAAGRAGRGTAD